MSPNPLTPKQQNVLAFIQNYMSKNNYAPTIAEICHGLKLSSTSTVHKHLKTLVEKGYLDSMPGRTRGLSMKYEPVQQTACVEVPLLGRVAAGLPIEMNEIPDTVSLPETMLGRGETFVLEVKGESMIDEAIKDGDYVIVEKRESARNGDMVIACIDNNEVTLKRIYREGSRIRLQPSNPTMKPIIIENQDVTIKGIVIGILRKYKHF
ncbi:MAG: transcriptional repressor LexA [Candidatus Riflebacteria bacterium]|jgi:repressor LexA|nr:transcriptional repressor LexA [Candidatus Riflebacteria bacterium]